MKPSDIKKFRTERDLDMKAAAKLCHVGYQSWLNWEHGRNPIPKWLDLVFDGVRYRS